MVDAPVFAGIDVAKDEVVIALLPTGEQWTSPTTPAALEEVVARLAGQAPALIVLEATGGLETAPGALLSEADLPVVVVNPRQVRDFACSRVRELGCFSTRGRPRLRCRIPVRHYRSDSLRGPGVR